MTEVKSFSTSEDAFKHAAQVVEQNNRVLETLVEKGQEQEEHYRQEQGFVARDEEAPACGPCSSCGVNVDRPCLPFEKEQQAWSGSGEGLELHPAINVYRGDGTLHFSDVLYGMPHEENIHGPYSGIDELVEGVKGRLGEIEPQFFGAKITPYIYTVAESQPLDPKVDEELMKASYRILKRLSTPERKKFLANLGRLEGWSVEGLSDAEVREFKYLFDKRD